MTSNIQYKGELAGMMNRLGAKQLNTDINLTSVDCLGLTEDSNKIEKDYLFILVYLMFEKIFSRVSLLYSFILHCFLKEFICYLALTVFLYSFH